MTLLLLHLNNSIVFSLTFAFS